MSKKKFREITVNEIKYGWTIKYDEVRERIVLSIWLDKKVIHTKTVKNLKTITPKFVSEVILAMK